MSDAGSGATIPFAKEVLRKLVHLSSLWMAALIFFWPFDQILLFYFFTVCLALNLLCEFAYSMQVPVITPVYGYFFRGMLRKQPKRGDWIVSGSPPVFAAAAAVTLFFPQFIAAISLGVMLVADTAAALIGRRFGHHKLNGEKSWEGSLAFLTAGSAFALAVLAFSGYFTVRMALGCVGGVFLAMLAELFQKQLKLDDNLTIPLSCGFVMTLVFYLF